MKESELYDGKNCPCPSDCRRRGNCKECIPFHHDRHQQTYCEFLLSKLQCGGVPERSLPSGKMIRLMDYGPCAG
ncbi:MAG: hypothetical protein KAT47_06875 [Candidatus Aegiribacteria sp.]|nr:hypothetical protein [Candidatus Aegiribacteria sp.]